MIEVHLIAAARPNFMKVAPLFHALRATDWCRPYIVHTGQHYDANMSDAFFRDLKIPAADFHLEIGSGTHAEQTGGVMIAYEKVATEHRPHWIVVVGDVNSTVACAMVGAKLGIPVIHLEAGLRSGDRRMPEEINRLATDAISDVLWTPSWDANENLNAEGVQSARIDLVGNIMIDSYELMKTAIGSDQTRQRLGLEAGGYAVVTLHRPSNVDSRDVLEPLMGDLMTVARMLPLVFVVHPRTRERLKNFGLLDSLQASMGVRLVDPLGYVQFMNLVVSAKACITDSGGVQEETTYLGIPCLTMRENTERPVTVSLGTNRLVTRMELLAKIGDVVTGRWPKGRIPDFWDGRAAHRCVSALRVRVGL